MEQKFMALRDFRPGAFLRLRRNVLGLTQAELAGMSGVPQSHISAFENHKRRISEAEETALAKAVSVPAHTLMGMKRHVVRGIFSRHGYDEIFLFGPVSTGQDDAFTPIDFLVSTSKPLGMLDLVGLQNELENELSTTVYLSIDTGLGNAKVDRVPREVTRLDEKTKFEPLLVDLYRSGNVFSPREIEEYPYFQKWGFHKSFFPYDVSAARWRVDDMSRTLDVGMGIATGDPKAYFAKTPAGVQSRFAAYHSISLLVESAAKIHSDVKEVNPEIPWAILCELRYRLMQTVDELDASIAWTTLHQDFPKILDALSSITYPGSGTEGTA
ncbi:helix-turn-helix domain-containing protein [Mobiluncus curtisii]|uniref:DNA-binding helix-turn-helix protein n=1 Tax=Mobiluncus curtisii ATCC 51333 TaxID=887326 RepID=E6LY75_9ACTO|nr:helix-turn-helix domain-containing protein [Mobiluncus curtisii]EFU80289.1 DNA-binding helix-turn-helix protein [Mobiluncus curtisii ATCC 51333]